MTTQGISSGASNILAKLNIADNWNTRYDSISENLEYTVEVDNRIDGNTKLSELQDKDGNNLNISEGAFYVYNNGVRTTEYITADMTVNDFMALLARNGLIADISEDGSISVGAYNNTYLATSATSGANSNIVSTLYRLLTFRENYMIPLKESGVKWGYEVQYMLTGQLNRHPREAMAFTAENRTDYCEFYKSLLDNF